MYCLFCVVLCIVCVCICVLYYCHRVATQLQLTNISYHIIHGPFRNYGQRCHYLWNVRQCCKQFLWLNRQHATAAHFLGYYSQQGKARKDLACLWVTIRLKCPDMWDTQDVIYDLCPKLSVFLDKKIPQYFSRRSCSSNSPSVKLWRFSPTIFSRSHHHAAFISF